MNIEQYDVIIIGGGIAGITAANTLTEYDITVLLLDESDQIGGQILKRPPGQQCFNTISGSKKEKDTGLKSIAHLRASNIEVNKRTKVVGVYPGYEILAEENQERLVKYTTKIILIATGGRERFVPFKGWTLPGVISTGALQLLLKRDNIIPADNVLLAGSGLFLYAVAHDIIANSGRVSMIVDQGKLIDNYGILRFVLEQGEKIKDGIKYMHKIYKSKVKIYRSSRIIEAIGEDCVEEVVVAKIDSNGWIVKGSEKKYTTKLLAIGNGFIPNIELAQTIGCELDYDATMSGWVVKVSSELETSVEGVFAAGELTGVAGAAKSITEGNLAALSIINKLDLSPQKEALKRQKSLQKERVKHLNFGKFFNSMARPLAGSDKNIHDDTIICRCEDVRFGDIKRAAKNGNISIESIKKATSLGMGNCQSRTCGPLIHDILASCLKVSAVNIKPISLRTPIKPIALSNLAKLKGNT